MGQYDGVDYPCNPSSKCEMTIGENFIFLNGYSLLSADKSVVKNTKIRLRVGNDVYTGSCEYSKDDKGCYVSFGSFLFNSSEIKKIINQILNTKGYLAIEVKQEYKPKDIKTRNTIWYTNVN
jgi:hypothetical protein